MRNREMHRDNHEKAELGSGVCPLCRKHCQLTAPQCSRGENYKETVMKDNAEIKELAVQPADTGANDPLLEQFRYLGHFLFHRSDGRGGQRRVMAILDEKGSIPQAELLQILQVQPGSMSELLSKLEEKGFIERSKDEEDRRSQLISITPAGREAVKDLHAEFRESAGDLFSCLNEEEKKAFEATLGKLRTDWDARFADLPRGFHGSGGRHRGRFGSGPHHEHGAGHDGHGSMSGPHGNGGNGRGRGGEGHASVGEGRGHGGEGSARGGRGNGRRGH